MMKEPTLINTLSYGLSQLKSDLIVVGVKPLALAMGDISRKNV